MLNAAPQVLKPGGRIVIISFQPLEDRIVKDAFREGAKQGHYKLLTKKPVTAGKEEIERIRGRAAQRCERRIGFTIFFFGGGGGCVGGGALKVYPENLPGTRYGR